MTEFKTAADPNYPILAGVIKQEGQALNARDYLSSKGIDLIVQVEFSGAYGLYVKTPEDASRVKLELLRLSDSPFADRTLRRSAWQRQGPAPRRGKSMRSGGLWMLQPFTVTTMVEIICILFYLLSFLPPAFNQAFAYLGLYNAADLHQLQLWRLITPIFFHFGILHIAFNLVMWEAFARPMERILGSVKLLSFTVVTAMLSNALQFAFIAQPAVFGGLSGVVYGLIGYLGVRSLQPDTPDGLRLPRGLLLVSLIFIGFGFFLSGIANLCHLGGIAVGALWGLIDSRRRHQL